MLAETSTSPDLISILRQPAVVFCLGIAILAYTVFRWRKMKKTEYVKKSATEISSGPTPQVITPSELRATANELHSLLADLNDMSRRIAAQVDNRYIKIDAMCAEADKKIKRLEDLLAQVEHYSLDPGDETAASEQIQSTQESQPQPEITVSSNPAATGMTSTYTRIYDLSDRGHSLHEIAQQVHLQPGEVDLILKLRPAKPAKN